MKSSARKSCSLAFLILILLSACTEKVWAQEQRPRVTIGYSAISAVFIPLWIAKEKDLYRRYGLDVDLIYIAGGSKLMQALLSGNVQFGGLGVGVIEANIQGGGTVYLAAWVNHFVFSIYGVPGLRSPLDLKGKKIGVTRFGTATEYATREAVKMYGVDARNDLTLIQTGGIPDTLAAIQAGAIHAGTISPPNTLLARKMGFVEVLDITKQKIPFIQAGLVSTKNYIDRNKQVTMSLMKAIIESINVIKSDKQYTKDVLSKYTRLKEDDLLDDTYSAFSKEFSEVPYPSVDALNFMVGIISQVQKRQIQIPVESFVDVSFLQSLEREGFRGKISGGK
jgi:NitT/TauT family transport system substrate-binding protein